MGEKQYLSQEKYNELVKELQELKTTKRKEISESLEFAKSLGDLSENAEYQEARESQATMEDRIAELEELLKNAEIISGSAKGTVGIGSVVSLEKADGGKKQFQIVGSEESDILNNKISNKSPLGEALMGKKIGDKISVNTPKGPVGYKIVGIE